MSELTILDLKDIVIPERVVKIPTSNQAFRVRGLDVYQLMNLFKDNIEVLDALLSGDVGPTIINDIFSKYPKLMAAIIAEASGSADNLKQASSLPAEVQMVALKEILELTFPDEELLGKFWAWLESKVGALVAAYQASKPTTSQ